ncbi:hypothetical protein CR513_04253, partial [Mucuna pruriens]
MTLYVPKLDENLLSIEQLLKHDFSLRFKNQECKFFYSKRRIVVMCLGYQQVKKKTRVCERMYAWKASLPTISKGRSNENKRNVRIGTYKSIWSYELIKALRSGKGKEYVSIEFEKFCENEGLERKLTIAWSRRKPSVNQTLKFLGVFAMLKFQHKREQNLKKQV